MKEMNQVKINISNQLINGFIASELELFKNQFGESPVPEIQDRRSLAITWLCYYFKSIITPKNTAAIKRYVDKVFSMDDYSHNGWYKIPALQAAAFILTSDTHYEKLLINQIDCKQTSTRMFILKCVGIICPLLSFDNRLLQTVTEENLKHNHFYREENVILYLLTKGTTEQKRGWLNEQILICTDEAGKKFLTELKAQNHFYKSSFFLKTFNEVKSYIIFKIFTEPIPGEVQPNLFNEIEIDFSEVANLEKTNPLNDYYIDFGFLKNE